MLHFNIVFTPQDMSVKMSMEEEKTTFYPDFGQIQFVTKAYNEYYEGDYEVTPKITPQTLETKDKLMSDDVTIKEIPFFETSNDSGGNTIYIGKEI